MCYNDLMRRERNEVENRSCEPPSPGLAAPPFIFKQLGFFYGRVLQYPKGVLEYPWSTPCGYPLSGNTWATTRVGDRHCAILWLRDLVAYSSDAI